MRHWPPAPRPSGVTLRFQPRPAASAPTSLRLWLQTSQSGARWQPREPPGDSKPRHLQPVPPARVPAPRSSPGVVVNPVQPASLQPRGHGELEKEQAAGQRGGDATPETTAPERQTPACTGAREGLQPASPPGRAPSLRCTCSARQPRLREP